MAVNDLSGLGVDSAPETHANIGVEEFSGGCCVNETLSVILHLGSDTLWRFTDIGCDNGMDGVRQVRWAENARCHDHSRCLTTAISFLFS